MSIEELLRAKRKEILEIAARHGARKVRIFGSVARREAGPDSDVDFLVELEPGTNLKRKIEAIMEEMGRWAAGPLPRGVALVRLLTDHLPLEGTA